MLRHKKAVGAKFLRRARPPRAEAAASLLRLLSLPRNLRWNRFSNDLRDLKPFLVGAPSPCSSSTFKNSLICKKAPSLPMLLLNKAQHLKLRLYLRRKHRPGNGSLMMTKESKEPGAMLCRTTCDASGHVVELCATEAKWLELGQGRLILFAKEDAHWETMSRNKAIRGELTEKRDSTAVGPLRSILGAGRMDAFECYSIQIRPYLHSLFDQCRCRPLSSRWRLRR